LFLDKSLGSPFKFHVDSISSGYVTAYGPGLVTGVTGEPALFTISTKGAGAGGLSMAVEGPSKAEVIQFQMNFNFNFN
jgi:filamin